MRKVVGLTAVIALSLGTITNAQATGLTFAAGQSGDSTMVYRLGAQFDFQSRWLASNLGHLSGYWDAGYTFWNGDDASSRHSVSLMPAFVYEFAGGTVKPYLEAGVGVAAFSSTHVESNNLGSAFQFEDRLGAGLRFIGGHELGIRFTHYSNAGIKQPNDGIETYTLHYRLNL